MLLYELKADLNAYLATRGTAAAASTLKDLIAFNERERAREMPHFGQELFIRAEAKGPLTAPEYLAASTLCRRLARDEGIDAVMTMHRLDALVVPTLGPAWPTDLLNGDHVTGSGTTPAAVAGYPSITVPAGWVGELPVGILFIGRAWSESRLIGLAFAYEQASRHRQSAALPADHSARLTCRGSAIHRGARRADPPRPRALPGSRWRRAP